MRTSACAGGPPPPHQIWQAAPRPRRRPSGCSRSRSASRSRPAGQLGGAIDAGREVLGRVRQAADLVDVDVVGAPQVERVERERRGELVERALVAERALHDAGRAERVRGLDVDQQRDRLGAHVRAAVERARRDRRRVDPAAHRVRDHRGDLDRRQRPVAARADAVASAAVEARWPAATASARRSLKTRTARPRGGAREVGGDHALGRRALLGAEAAAHELAGDVHAVGVELEGASRAAARASQMPCVET